jgi:hypothetical protein
MNILLRHPLVGAITQARDENSVRAFEKLLVAHAHDPRLPGVIVGIFALAHVWSQRAETRAAAARIIRVLGDSQLRLLQARGEL